MTSSITHCQSCGMPLSRDRQGGGTEKDGSRSPAYCSHCYQGGEFQNPAIDTAEKMQAHVKAKMKEMGIPGFLTGIFTRKIPHLDRWKG